MASLTSESDSETSGSEETQHHLSHCFFQSHYGRESRLSESTSTCGAANSLSFESRGKCPFCFASSCLLMFLRLQSMATLKEGDEMQMWVFIRI